jgi:hypothetical protein
LPTTNEVAAAAAGGLRAALDNLVGGAHRAEALRADLTSADIPLLLELLSTRIPVTGARAAALSLRYLDLILAGPRSSALDRPTGLRGPAPHWAERRAVECVRGEPLVG